MRTDNMPVNNNAPSVDVDVEESNDDCVTCFSSYVGESMKCFFAALGFRIASAPKTWIGLSMLFCILSCAGFMNYTTESRAEKLWVPQNAIALDHSEFVKDNYGDRTRVNVIIMQPKNGNNVLEPSVLLSMLDLYDEIQTINVTVESEYSNDFPYQYDINTLCKRAGPTCLQTSILDLFQYNRTFLESFNTAADISNYINNLPLWLAMTGSPMEEKSVLGGVHHDNNGDITYAEAAQWVFFLEGNVIVVNGDEIDPPGEAFEFQVNKLIEKPYYGILEITGFNSQALSAAFSESIGGDIMLLSIGYILIIIYVVYMLGPRHIVHSKIAVAFAGIFSIIMSIGTCYGLASAFGVFFGPVHNVLPFLLLGIGVDDMFIIVNSYHNSLADAQRKNKTLSIPHLIEDALGHAGVSITVTSISDALAFLIGSSTSLPALSSFCIYATLGVMFDFIYQVTFFVACLALDAERARENKRDCCCWVVVSEEEGIYDEDQQAEVCGKPTRSPRSFLRNVYAKWILTKNISISICLFFLTLCGVGIYGATQLKQEFSFEFFIPDNSFLINYYDLADKYFKVPVSVDIVCLEYDMYNNQDQLDLLHQNMLNSHYLDGTISSFYTGFVEYYTLYNGVDASVIDNNTGYITSETDFYTSLSIYLSTSGQRFVQNVKWNDENDPQQGVRTSRFSVTYKNEKVENSEKQVLAMQHLRKEVSKASTIPSFPFGFEYIFWEQYAVIEVQLMQNIILSLVAIFIVTELLIAHPLTASLVCLCVSLTLIDVLGVMYIWELGIDSVAVVNLVLAIGLAVDYNAHIGHCFMTYTGTNKERVRLALGDIGGSVLNGAFSTFLAILCLSASQSYVFRVFFKQFFAICVLGCAHGMILLPVLLSWFGPAPYSNAREGHWDDASDVRKVIELEAVKVGPSKEVIMDKEKEEVKDDDDESKLVTIHV